jgi:hypothetical protein
VFDVGTEELASQTTSLTSGRSATDRTLPVNERMSKEMGVSLCSRVLGELMLCFILFWPCSLASNSHRSNGCSNTFAHEPASYTVPVPEHPRQRLGAIR